MKNNMIIANASGFWGDEAAAVARQIRGGKIDYLTMDYLAEITMIILAKQRVKNDAYGYATDFVSVLRPLLREISEKGITVISNAGGINPKSCAKALQDIIAEQRLDLPVAVVSGDDLMPDLADLYASGCRFNHLESAEELSEEKLNRTIAANAYIGARPIVTALQNGARIVITGRCYDAASVVAPMVYEFGWQWDDYDRLASGLIAGHLIECGAQSTGGNFSLWRKVPSFENMGYPLVNVNQDGTFIVTKHPETGGLVSNETVKEQLLYEISDPRLYMSPDVIADFTTAKVQDDGPNRVRVTGLRGQKPTDCLKVSMGYKDGYKVVGRLLISGPNALDKAKMFSKIFWGRLGDDFIEKRTDYGGYSACWGESASPECDPNDIILRFAARSHERGKLEQLSREVSGLILAGPPGVTVFGGRSQVSEAYGYWPALIPRKKVNAKVRVNGRLIDVRCDQGKHGEPMRVPAMPARTVGIQVYGETVKVKLSTIAHARSGDKGDIVNIGVAALKPEYYKTLLEKVTEQKVQNYFSSNVKGTVKRYYLENIYAVNFVLQKALDGGGTVSLLPDNQGKTLAQALLNMEVEVPRELML